VTGGEGRKGRGEKGRGGVGVGCGANRLAGARDPHWQKMGLSHTN